MNRHEAEAKLLLYKLDKIRSHIERRISVVDAPIGYELSYILKMIESYDTVPADWQLSRPLVNKEEQ